MKHSHEKWMDEPRGKVPHGRGRPNSDRYEREHYVAPHAWDNQPTGTPFTEADREQMTKWQGEIELINQMHLENQAAMAE